MNIRRRVPLGGQRARAEKNAWMHANLRTLMMSTLLLALHGCAEQPRRNASGPAQPRAVATASRVVATPVQSAEVVEPPQSVEPPGVTNAEPPGEEVSTPEPAAEPQRPRISPLDAHALAAPRHVENDIQRLARYLVRPARSDREKARVIYRWITDRIAYDAPSFLSGNYADQSPDVTLRARKGVCGGYANLYQALGLAVGLKVEVVTGTAKGLSFRSERDMESNHAWNAVLIDGEWELIDSTWGAGGLDGQTFAKAFNEHYFCVAPEALICSHYPDDVKWQLLAKPLSAQQFLRQPQLEPEFFAKRMRLLDSASNPLVLDPSHRIELSVPPDILVTAQLYKKGVPVEGNHYFLTRRADRLTVEVSGPGEGEYELALFHRERGQDAGSSFATWQLQCRSVPGHHRDYPTMLEAYLGSQVQLDSPRQDPDSAPRKTRFELRVAGADEVYVLNGEDQLDLLPLGDSYVGEYPLERGQASVFAHFPEGDRTEALLLYDVK